ncbi:MAG: D-alanine--D-alanine ligase family protein [Nannocystaceae bacterium]
MDMQAKRQTLVLVFGGRSSEHEVSLRSATSVLQAVDRERFEVVALGIRRDGAWVTGPCPDSREATPARLAQLLATGTTVPDLRALGADVVFPLLHGPFGEDGTFQGLLEVLDLPYVGSGVLGSSLCMDKGVSKQILHHLSPPIPQIPWVEFDARTRATEMAALGREVAQKLGYPCFVKPANQGSSVGISRATTGPQLATAIELAGRYDAKIVIEKAVDAREIELAVLGDGGPQTLVSSPGEIVLPPDTWYDYNTKYVDDVAGLQIPADIPAEVIAQLQTLSLQAFRACGCHGLARVDFLVERGTWVPYLNEINTLPGFTTISMYPKLMGHAGVSYTELITRLCELALGRHRQRQALQATRD